MPNRWRPLKFETTDRHISVLHNPTNTISVSHNPTDTISSHWLIVWRLSRENAKWMTTLKVRNHGLSFYFVTKELICCTYPWCIYIKRLFIPECLNGVKWEGDCIAFTVWCISRTSSLSNSRTLPVGIYMPIHYMTLVQIKKHMILVASEKISSPVEQ
jgi:hypothetical protein